MRALIAVVIVALIAGGARADDLYRRGRREQHAAIALFVIGSAAIVASGPFFALSMGYNCPATVPTCGTSPLLYWGIAFLAGGAAAHGVGMPLYIAGSSDVDRYRSGSPPSMPVATVRF